MKASNLATALALCLGICCVAAGQGLVVINDPPTTSDSNASSDKLTPSEQAVMDKYVLPKVRAKLASGACEESVDISGRLEGSFTKPQAKQIAIFYQFCQTGNGFGSAGVAVLEEGKVVGNFVAPDSGWTNASAVLPDINNNGLNELALYYSGGIHQGEGGTGVDIVEYSAGNLKGIGWFQADGFSETGPTFGYKVTVKTGSIPSFFREKWVQNNSGKWRRVALVAPLKLGPTVGKFEAL